MNNELKAMYRNDFVAFARKAILALRGSRVSHDRYLEYLANILMEFLAGVFKRLIINLPPRHLKTDFCSICLAAWILAHNPKAKIMILSCTEELAEKIARSIRAILKAEWFHEVFSIKIKKGHGKVTHFSTTAGGEVFAASIHGNFTGYGADIIIVDDPHQIPHAGDPEKLVKVIEAV